MKFYIITPRKHVGILKKIPDAGYFCLAHVALRDQQYLEFFVEARQQGHHVILDNGAAENSLVSIDDLLRLVWKIHPSVVVSPDALFNRARTSDLLQRFLFDLQYHQSRDPLLRETKVMAVPQGRTMSEWIKSYFELVEHPGVDMIGLSRIAVMVFESFTKKRLVSVNRQAAVDVIRSYQLPTKPTHCLGMRDYREFLAYEDLPWIISSDSAFTGVAAYNGWSLKQASTYLETPHDYFDLEMDEKALKRFIDNATTLINTYKK